VGEVTIAAKDGGSFSGYLAEPQSGKGAGIVVIQEIFGVNMVMREICDDLARSGYFALCPDLFWRQQPGIQLTDQTDADWNRAFQLYKGFDEAKGVDDLIQSLAHLRKVKGVSGKVGTIGYCLGGKLAYLMATRSDADCSIGYYGVTIEIALREAAQIKKPLLLHIAEKDQFCPPEGQAKIKNALAGNTHVTIHSYPGCDHAFARIGGAHYDPDAATLANGRSEAFFKTNLQ
jgi:carboxymethylenebutenolidase